MRRCLPKQGHREPSEVDAFMGRKKRLWEDQTAKAILGEEERAERRAKMSEKQILYDSQQSGRL